MPEYFYARMLLCPEATSGDYALRLSGGLTPLLEAPAAVNEQPP